MPHWFLSNRFKTLKQVTGHNYHVEQSVLEKIKVMEDRDDENRIKLEKYKEEQAEIMKAKSLEEEAKINDQETKENNSTIDRSTSTFGLIRGLFK